MTNWLDKYEQGGLVLKKKTKDNYGKKANPNDVKVSVGPDFVGLGYNTKGRDYSPAWGGQFAMGGVLPGAVGFTYARVAGSAPANGKYTKKTLASAQNGTEMPSVELTIDNPQFTIGTKSGTKESTADNLEKRSFSNAYSAARKEGKTKFSYRGKDYSTKYKGTPEEQLRTTGITDAQLHDRNIIQDQLAKNLSGVGYEFSEAAGALFKKNDFRKKLEDAARTGKDAENSGWSSEMAKRRLDAQNLYNGLPQQYGTFAVSKNRPSEATDKNAIYYSITNDKLRDQLRNMISMGKYAPAAEFNDNYRGGPLGENRMVRVPGKNAAVTYDDSGIMGDYTTSLGRDDKGEYVSYYDKWDIAPMDFGKPMEIYDKIYLNDLFKEYNKPKMQNGGEMEYYQNGLDFKPKSISKNGSKVIKDNRGQWAHPGEITEIGSPDITMQGVDYPVLGISDTGDTQMMQPNQDYKFDGEKVTEYPMMQEGGWLDKYPEPMRQDATRNVIPRKMTTQEKKEAEEASKKAIVASKARDEKIIAERKKNISTKGDLNTPGSWHTEDKFRMFPGDINGVGEMIDEYINPATYVGLLTDALGESIAKRDPKGIATSLALSAVGGALGIDPLGGAIKTAKGFVKPSFTSGKEALDFLNTKVDDIGEENVIKIISKKTGKTRKQIEDEFTQAVGNADNPRDPEYIIRQANILNGGYNLPKFPKSLKELDEKAGKLVSKPNNVSFDKTEIINRANEILEKGVGVKKKNISVKLESTPNNVIEVKVNDNNPYFPVLDYNKSGYMNLEPNFHSIDTKSTTFTEWLQGKKPETRFVKNWGDFETEPAFTKIGDFPYDNRPDLKGTGVGAEAAEAMKQALEEKGIKLQSSTNHTQEGRLRYLTEFLNDRKKAINTEGNPGWIDVVNNIKESLKGKKVSKEEVQELMDLNPKIDPKSIRFQYKEGGWLNKYK